MSRRRPGRNKRKWVRDRMHHVRVRAKEHYGIDVTDDEIRALQEQIASSLLTRRSPPVPRVHLVQEACLRRPYPIYVVAFGAQWLPVIYEHCRRTIHTVLPPELLPQEFSEPP